MGRYDVPHQPHVRDAELPFLHHGDDPWLEQLTEERITSTWLKLANETMEVGSAARLGMRPLPENAKYSRDYFYEDLLNFASPNSPVHRAYTRVAARQHAVAPIDTFVRSMRTVHADGLNTMRVSRSFPGIWEFAPPAITQNIAEFRSDLGYDFANKILESSAIVLSYRDYPRSVLWARRVADTLHWSPDDLAELITVKPKLVTGSRPQLLLGARYLTRFAELDVTPSQVGNMLLVHPDRQMVALDRDVPRYTYFSIGKITEDMTAQECREEAQEILFDPERSRQFGSSLIAAHQRFHERQRKATAIMKPDVTEGSDA